MSLITETKRLLIRKFVPDDAEAVYTFGSCKETSRYTGDKQIISSVEDALKIIQDIWLPEYEKYGYSRNALVHKGDNRVIGFTGMKFIPEEGMPDLGYRMLPKYWGNGLGFEAASATLDHARDHLKLKDIFADVLPDNLASCRILEKLGFQFSSRFSEDDLTVIRYVYPN